jgi:hypothetical protein
MIVRLCTKTVTLSQFAIITPKANHSNLPKILRLLMTTELCSNTTCKNHCLNFRIETHLLYRILNHLNKWNKISPNGLMIMEIIPPHMMERNWPNSTLFVPFNSVDMMSWIKGIWSHHLSGGPNRFRMQLLLF